MAAPGTATERLSLRSTLRGELRIERRAAALDGLLAGSDAVPAPWFETMAVLPRADAVRAARLFERQGDVLPAATAHAVAAQPVRPSTSRASCPDCRTNLQVTVEPNGFRPRIYERRNAMQNHGYTVRR